MSDTRTPAFRNGAVAVIFYGDQSMGGRVAKVVTSRTGNVRRVGITPDGTDVVAWFAPVPDSPAHMNALVSVGGASVAYV